MGEKAIISVIGTVTDDGDMALLEGWEFDGGRAGIVAMAYRDSAELIAISGYTIDELRQIAKENQ